MYRANIKTIEMARQEKILPQRLSFPNLMFAAPLDVANDPGMVSVDAGLESGIPLNALPLSFFDSTAGARLIRH